MKRSGIGNIIEIMKNDFKSAFSNPIVTIVLIGLIILPSLYALLNIQACWDPYGNTGEVEFAIANLDKGASFQDTKLNVGDELEKLMTNSNGCLFQKRNCEMAFIKVIIMRALSYPGI